MTAFLSLFSLRISATSSLFASDWSEACNTLHLASCEKLRLKRSLTGHEEVDKNQSKPVGVVASPDSSHGIERDWSEESGRCNEARVSLPVACERASLVPSLASQA